MNLLHLSFIWAGNRFPAFFLNNILLTERTSISQLSKCKVIVSIDNKSIVSTTLKKEV